MLATSGAPNDTLTKEFGCVPGGNSEIRAAKAPEHREIYANHSTAFVKEGSAGAARCGRSVINDLVLEHVAYMPLCGGRSDELL